MKILELKNIIAKVKSSMDGLNSRIEGTEETLCESEDRKIQVTQKRKNRLKI